MSQPPSEETAVRVDNTWGLVAGENLPNHTTSLNGLGKFVKAVNGGARGIEFRTKQEAYRFMAHLLALCDRLPDEDGSHSLDEVCQAVEDHLAK